MQTRIINSINGVSSGSNVDSGVSLANDKEKNEDNKHHHVVLDTTLDVSSSISMIPILMAAIIAVDYLQKI